MTKRERQYLEYIKDSEFDLSEVILSDENIDVLEDLILLINKEKENNNKWKYYSNEGWGGKKIQEIIDAAKKINKILYKFKITSY